MKEKQEKLFVCEFITGGGLSDETLPESLVREGTMMRDALLRDLQALNQYALITLHDARLPQSSLVSKRITVDAGAFKKTFKKALKQADLVWLIAPETDGALLELTELCLAEEDKAQGAQFLGCGFDATLIGTSKSLTFDTLQAAGIHTLPVYSGEDLIQPTFFEAMSALNVAKWVAKPEDGAGCEGIRLFDSLAALRDWLLEDQRYLMYFAQPYQSGINASFAFLSGGGGQAWLLCCNEQHISQADQLFKLTGITVNGMTAYWQRFETLMRKLAKVLPDALGYVGVDVIIDPMTNRIDVIDINPRLTSSYVGLSEAMGCNAAKLILDSQCDAHFKMPHIQKNIVEMQW